MKRTVKGFPVYDDHHHIDSAAIHHAPHKNLPPETDPTAYTELYLHTPENEHSSKS